MYKLSKKLIYKVWYIQFILFNKLPQTELLNTTHNYYLIVYVGQELGKAWLNPPECPTAASKRAVKLCFFLGLWVLSQLMRILGITCSSWHPCLLACCMDHSASRTAFCLSSSPQWLAPVPSHHTTKGLQGQKRICPLCGIGVLHNVTLNWDWHPITFAISTPEVCCLMRIYVIADLPGSRAQMVTWTMGSKL